MGLFNEFAKLILHTNAMSANVMFCLDSYIRITFDNVVILIKKSILCKIATKDTTINMVST